MARVSLEAGLSRRMPSRAHTATAHHHHHHGAGHRAHHMNWRYFLLVVLAITSVAAVFVFTELDWRQIPGLLQRVSRPLALLIMATLPLIGFPISAVYLGAGALFGPWLGLVVVTGVTAVHLVVTQLLATTVLRAPIVRWRKKWSKKLPEVPPKEHATLVAMIVLVPGLPYFARNCLLALSSVPWGVLMGVGLPIYVIRSCATIFLGDLGSDPSLPALFVLGAIYVAKLTATFFLFQRLRHNVHRRRTRAKH
jgi:uncharacterized membrane protein YdjX (TVP38/TMEM64 family)